jgi:hypothetical protein
MTETAGCDCADPLHGYTMLGIDMIAKAAVTRARARSMDYRDRFDAAWHAIAEQVFTSPGHPVPAVLREAGTAAVNRLAQDEGRHRGFDRRNPAEGFEGMRAFQAYWLPYRWAVQPPDNPVTERLALAQIWPELSPAHQAILIAMAVLARATVPVTGTPEFAALTDAIGRYDRLQAEGEPGLSSWHQALHDVAQQARDAANGLEKMMRLRAEAVRTWSTGTSVLAAEASMALDSLRRQLYAFAMFDYEKAGGKASQASALASAAAADLAAVVVLDSD